MWIKTSYLYLLTYFVYCVNFCFALLFIWENKLIYWLTTANTWSTHMLKCFVYFSAFPTAAEKQLFDTWRTYGNTNSRRHVKYLRLANGDCIWTRRYKANSQCRRYLSWYAGLCKEVGLQRSVYGPKRDASLDSLLLLFYSVYYDADVRLFGYSLYKLRSS